MVLVQFCGNSFWKSEFSETLCVSYSSHVVFLCFFSNYPHMWVPSSEGSLHRAQWQLEKQKTWISFAILNLEEFCLLTWRTSTWRCPFFFESCQQLRKRTFEKSEKKVPWICKICWKVAHLVEISSPFLIGTWDLSSKLRSGSFW